MSVFSKILQYFRKVFHWRPRPVEKLCTAFQSYGMDAHIEPNPCEEMKIGADRRRTVNLLPFYIGWSSSYGGSAGLVRLGTGPIRWINILVYQSFSNDPLGIWYVFGIPDDKIRKLGIPAIRLQTIGVKKFPWLGEVIAINWTGNDFGTGLIERLKNLPLVNMAIIESHHREIDADIEVSVEPIVGCWTITTKKIPTNQLWESYQSLANELLATTLSYG